jgi:hypothetical protein
MDLEIKTTTSVDADIENVVSITVAKAITSDTISSHTKETSTSGNKSLISIIDLDSKKEFEVTPEYTVQAHTVDLKTECFTYNILDRWQEYTYDMSNNVCVFNINLPSR